jgi:4-carboxymuconolactone decarboxylase
MTTDADRIRNGEKNRRRVLGDAHVDRSLKNRTEFNGEWVDFITRTAWGDIWQRPGLDYKSRSIVVLSVATALGRWEEFRIHVKGAIHNGLTKDEIKEVLMQCAIYAGVPA